MFPKHRKWNKGLSTSVDWIKDLFPNSKKVAKYKDQKNKNILSFTIKISKLIWIARYIIKLIFLVNLENQQFFFPCHYNKLWICLLLLLLGKCSNIWMYYLWKARLSALVIKQRSHNYWKWKVFIDLKDDNCFT